MTTTHSDEPTSAEASDELTARLEDFAAALGAHFDALEGDRDDTAVEAAYERLAGAFDAYEALLFSECDEVTPLELA